MVYFPMSCIRQPGACKMREKFRKRLKALTALLNPFDSPGRRI